jgi:hypothetical protein
MSIPPFTRRDKIAPRSDQNDNNKAHEMNGVDGSGQISFTNDYPAKSEEAEPLAYSLVISDPGKSLGDRRASCRFGEDLGAWRIRIHKRDLIGETNQRLPGPGKQGDEEASKKASSSFLELLLCSSRYHSPMSKSDVHSLA